MAVNPMLVGGIGVGVTAAAVTGGLYAGGVIGGGASDQENRGNNRSDTKPETPWWPLSEDAKFAPATGSEKPYEGKWGATYARYLVGAGTIKDDSTFTTKNNTEWWNNKYSEFNNTTNKKPTTGKFASVSSGEALKTVCDGAYKATTDKVTQMGSGNEEYKEEEVWKYCSPSGTKIKTLKDATDETYDTDKIGQKPNNRNVLVASKKAENNKWFWKHKLEELKIYGEWTQGANNKFKALKDKANTTGDELRSTCDTAYTKTDSDTDYPKKEIFLFCSLSGTAPNP